MATDPVFDYGTPYNIMVGFWIGLADVYSIKGEYQGSMSSSGAVYWKEPNKKLHFRQDPEDTSNRVLKNFAHQRAVVQRLTLEYDLDVDGKYCDGASGGVHVTGTEMRPDVYHFHLKFPDVDWYNIHRFMGENERNVLGPSVAHDGTIQMVVSQTLTRISYDVPNEFRRELKK
jgi:hypothetical protein